MVILLIKHIDIEGPGTFGDFLSRGGYPTRILDSGAGDILPNDTGDIRAVICLGGPMNVYEEEKYPFLRGENIFIQKILDQQIPYLGICLGSQLLAKACGANVVKSPREEIGFSMIRLTHNGRRDPLFQGLEQDVEVYQWHEDMFEVPEGGSLLASSAGCPHQAFKVGPNAYGLQFHIEITDQSIREWSDAYLRKNPCVLKEEKTRMLEEYRNKKESFEQTAEIIYNNFLGILK